MAGTLKTLTNLISPVTVTAHLRSQNSKSNDRSFDAINNLFISRKVRSVRRTLIIRNHANSDQVQGNGGPNPNESPRKSGFLSFPVLAEPLLSFASSNFLPLALIGGVALGLANPGPGCLAHRYQLSIVSTFGIFVISGLRLRSEDIGAAAEAWPVGLFGLASILLFTPLLSKIILQLRFQPQEFVTGLALFSCMPTTLSSGVALTRLAGGNCALALAMTVASSLLAIMMAFRESFKGLAEFVDNNNQLLSVLSVILLSLVPWIQVSRSRPLLVMVKPEAFLVAVMMGALLHLILLGFNATSIRCLCAVSGGSKSIFAKKKNSTALLLIASQKALPVLVAVVDQLGGTFGEPGLLIIPCVAAHLNQIIMDSFLITFWNKKDQSLANT
ncbi:probable sodium/metabolite cotransporter BASS4, chloroplastic isoform X2 [Lactuca sativa]|uniref:probable sodium/metabolite cotransporter BASS4, chloroplastic isoform X2 n=1 Tax=Lactuca sativa TaxID=4236 RepID=UPI000CD91A18|nr:probable sodium/metabolite cotransporter BASS4, chloroplastic isoform X2 [Lactuca sativa]